MIALTGQNNWELSAIDIKTAFLQGKPITRDVYVIPTKEANTSYFWKLKKCIYGLVDASRNWYDSLKSFLLSIGLSTSKSDPSMFYYTENKIVGGFLTIHVNILWSGSNNFEHKIITKLRNCFIIGKENSMPFQYLGLNLSENSMKNTFLDQSDYISQSVQVSNIHTSTSIPDRMRSTVGKLLWISTQTRPDISFNVCQLANRIKSATENDLKFTLNVIKHVQNDEVVLNIVILARKIICI